MRNCYTRPRLTQPSVPSQSALSVRGCSSPLCDTGAGCTFCSPPMGKLEERTVTACSEEWYK